MSYEKESLSTIPIWVRFPKLNVKYWGKKSLTKLVGMPGPVLKVDGATSNKERMFYARVLVDLNITKGFHDSIYYENEHGELVSEPVTYDWKPSWCSKCNQIGHQTDLCKADSIKPSIPGVQKPPPSVDK